MPIVANSDTCDQASLLTRTYDANMKLISHVRVPHGPDRETVRAWWGEVCWEMRLTDS